MVLSVAAICICTARRLSNNFPTFGMAFSVPSRRRVRNSLMQIALLTAKGSKYGMTCTAGYPAADHRILATPSPGKTFTRAVTSFVNRFPIPYRAATKIVSSILMPPRRRREGPSPQRPSGVKVLPRAAYPTVPEPDLHHRSTLPAGGSQQQRSIHHQARDTLQGDEGA